jgi:hypothetical protein
MKQQNQIITVQHTEEEENEWSTIDHSS